MTAHHRSNERLVEEKKVVLLKLCCEIHSTLSSNTCERVLLLTETEEKGVHTHCVHTEESMGDEVGANYHSLVRKINKSDFIQNPKTETTTA